VKKIPSKVWRIRKVPYVCGVKQTHPKKTTMNNATITLTAQSEIVSAAILDIQEREGGMGAGLSQVVKATGLEVKMIRGNISDLVQKGIITIDLKEHSGASCDMYYHSAYEW